MLWVNTKIKFLPSVSLLSIGWAKQVQTQRNVRLLSKCCDRTLFEYCRSPREGTSSDHGSYRRWWHQIAGKDLTRWRKGKDVCSEEYEKRWTLMHRVEKWWVRCVHGAGLSGASDKSRSDERTVEETGRGSTTLGKKSFTRLCPVGNRAGGGDLSCSGGREAAELWAQGVRVGSKRRSAGPTQKAERKPCRMVWRAGAWKGNLVKEFELGL